MTAYLDQLSINPTKNRVVVRPLEEEEKIAGLAIIRNTNAEMKTGIIVAAGPDSELSVDQKVLYNPAAGTLLRDNFTELRIMLDDSIQAYVS